VDGPVVAEQFDLGGGFLQRRRAELRGAASVARKRSTGAVDIPATLAASDMQLVLTKWARTFFRFFVVKASMPRIDVLDPPLIGRLYSKDGFVHSQSSKHPPAPELY
jgi:hypothetical protein